MNTLVRRSLGCLADLSLALAIAPAALAGSPVDPTTLTPVPPDVYTCQADGPHTICRASFVDPLEGADDGPLCGDLHFFEWVTVNLDTVRTYDADTNLVGETDRDAGRSAVAAGRSLRIGTCRRLFDGIPVRTCRARRALAGRACHRRPWPAQRASPPTTTQGR